MPSGSNGTVEIPDGFSTTLYSPTGRYLQVTCLPADAPKGSVLPITFTFSNKATIDVAVPVGMFAPDATPVPTTGAGGC